MNRQEKIQKAKERINELKTLIYYWETKTPKMK